MVWGLVGSGSSCGCWVAGGLPAQAHARRGGSLGNPGGRVGSGSDRWPLEWPRVLPAGYQGASTAGRCLQAGGLGLLVRLLAAPRSYALP